VGNAVSVPVAEWIGSRLRLPIAFDTSIRRPFPSDGKWPSAAFGINGQKWKIEIGEFPLPPVSTPLRKFLNYDLQPLSLRAARGFMSRFERSSLKKNRRFLSDLRKYVRVLEQRSTPTPETTRKMKSIAQQVTDIETDLVKALKSTRLTFEQNTRAAEDVKTRPDIVFRKKRVAIYVDGCFWHSCPHHGTQPRSNSEFWSHKLQRNVERDAANTRALETRGWKVLRFWGHEGAPEMVKAIQILLRSE
jgi:DNA mismatch endonuclease Vsr